MTIEFHCDECNTLLRTSDDKAGRRARCPNCGATIVTPSPDADDEFDDDAEWEPEDEDEEDDFDRYFGGRPPTTYSKPPPSRGRKKSCPMCGEEISAAARQCPFCGERVGGPPRSGYARSIPKPTSAMAITSFIMGLFGLLGCCIWFLSLPLSLMGIIFGILGIQNTKTGEYQGGGLAIAGLVLGILGTLFSGFFLVAFLGNMN